MIDFTNGFQNKTSKKKKTLKKKINQNLGEVYFFSPVQFAAIKFALEICVFSIRKSINSCTCGRKINYNTI